MNTHDLDSLRRLTRERHAQRLCEADAERLAREFRATGKRRGRLRLTVKPAFGASHRRRPRRLET